MTIMPYKQRVTGSNPVAPTSISATYILFVCGFFLFYKQRFKHSGSRGQDKTMTFKLPSFFYSNTRFFIPIFVPLNLQGI